MVNVILASAASVVVRFARRRFAARQRQVAGLEELFAGRDPARPLPCRETYRFDVRKVGRQESHGRAILDVSAWLEASGWYGEDRGWVQCYAAWLLRRRADYERQGAEIS